MTIGRLVKMSVCLTIRKTKTKHNRSPLKHQKRKKVIAMRECKGKMSQLIKMTQMKMARMTMKTNVATKRNKIKRSSLKEMLTR